MERSTNNIEPKEKHQEWMASFIDKLQEYAMSLGANFNDTIVIEQDIQKFRSLVKIKIEYIQGQSLYGLRGPVNHKILSDTRSLRTPASRPQGDFGNTQTYAVMPVKTKILYSAPAETDAASDRAGKTNEKCPDYNKVESSILINKRKRFDDI